MSRRNDMGKYRHRVVFYNIVRDDDGAGGDTRSDPSVDDEIGTFWAEVRPMSPEEITRAGMNEESVMNHIKTRFNALFVDGMTIKHKGQLMYVESVIDSSQLKEFMTLYVREGGPQ